MDNYTLLGFAFVALIGLVVYFLKRKPPVSRKKGDPAVANSWEIGPPYKAGKGSKNMPLHPIQDGDKIVIPLAHPTQEVGHANYVTHIHGVPKAGTTIKMEYEVVMEPGVQILSKEAPGYAHPHMQGHLTPLIQRVDDDWKAQGEMEYARWYGHIHQPLVAGVHYLEIDISPEAGWGAVLTSQSIEEPKKFYETIKEVCKIGFVLGGSSDGWGHGVYATGPAYIIIRKFIIE